MFVLILLNILFVMLYVLKFIKKINLNILYVLCIILIIANLMIVSIFASIHAKTIDHTNGGILYTKDQFEDPNSDNSPSPYSSFIGSHNGQYVYGGDYTSTAQFDNNWGPSYGWYLLIVSTILLCLQLIILKKNSKSIFNTQ